MTTAGARFAALAMAVSVGVVGCHRGSRANGTGAGTAGEESASEVAPLGPMDERERAQWAAAKDGDAEELMRLADAIGCEGLRQRAQEQDAAPRAVAIRAMRYCRDFGELPWLSEVAAGGDDGEARLALEAIGELAARPRRATDPEDALELHEGCTGLLDLARSAKKSRERRVLAVSALRMLAERGCVARTEIPTDLDAR
jgi:hypothetical protein